MRVGYFIEGIGAIARGNVRRDITGKIGWIHPSGKSLNSNNAATFENRGLNFAGENIIIENNDLEVERHNFVSGYKSVDGEGILIQWQDPWGFDTNNPASGANTRMYDITIRNNRANSYIGIYDIQLQISNLHITGNDLLGKGNVLVFKKERIYRIDNLYIENNVNITGIAVGNKVGTEYAMPGSNIYIRNNMLSSGGIGFPYQAIVSGNINASWLSEFSTAQALPKVQLPYHGAYNVSDTASLKLEFSHPIEAVNLGGIYLQSNLSGQKKFLSSTINDKTLNILNQDGFSDNMSTYTVVVPAGAVKLSGTDIQNDSIGWTFRADAVDLNTGLLINGTESLHFYPNPAYDYIQLSGTGLRKVQLRIFSINGQLLFEKQVVDNDKISLTSLAKGLYFVSINDNPAKLIKK